MADTDSTTDHRAERRLEVVAGAAGLTALVLIFAVLVGSATEPPFDAGADAFLAHYRSSNTVASPARSFLLTLGLVAFLWFVVAVSLLLRRAEGDAAWRSPIGIASGVVFVVLVLSGSEVAAAFRADDLDPQIARYAFDESQAAFANARVALGSFALCCGWVIVCTRVLPRWLGWLAIVSGAGLVLARVAWTNQIWLLPYLMFWVWVLCVSVLLLRRNVARPASRNRRPAG
jgi:hypothetical protein